VLAASLLVLLLSLSACRTTSSPGPNATRSAAPSASPSPTVDPKVAEATRNALAAYNGYLAAYATASQAGNPDDPNLAQYVGDPLLSLTRHNVRQLQTLGQVQLGAQKATVTSSQANLSAAPPTVTVNACLDYSDLRLVYKSNQSPVPNSSLKVTRVSAVATVAQYPDGRWLVNETKQGAAAC
jgi:hypothetical protein